MSWTTFMAALVLFCWLEPGTVRSWSTIALKAAHCLFGELASIVAAMAYA